MRGEPCSVRGHQDCALGPECCENGAYTAGDDGGSSLGGFGRVCFQLLSCVDVGETCSGRKLGELFRVRLEEVRLSCGITHQGCRKRRPGGVDGDAWGYRPICVRPESTRDCGVEVRGNSWWERARENHPAGATGTVQQQPDQGFLLFT